MKTQQSFLRTLLLSINVTTMDQYDSKHSKEIIPRDLFKDWFRWSSFKNTNISYRSWKYWNSPMLHAKSLAVVATWDVYLKVKEAEGNLDLDQKMSPLWTYTILGMLYQSKFLNMPQHCGNFQEISWRGFILHQIVKGDEQIYQVTK